MACIVTPFFSVTRKKKTFIYTFNSKSLTFRFRQLIFGRIIASELNS